MKEDSRELNRLIAQRIVRYIQDHGLEPGYHLTASGLAEAFGVSRSPVREALSYLADLKAVEARPKRGFFVAMGWSELQKLSESMGSPATDLEPHIRVARDRLVGLLPQQQFTETQLMRRYQLTRRQVQVILARMAREGWVERRPGYGWAFLPILTSPQAHLQSYRFRMAIEPAAILEPTFKVDVQAFARCRDKQKALLAADFRRLPWARIFEGGAEFHETVCACSGNPFFLDALRQANRLRSLIEYRISLSEEKFRVQFQEHLELLDMIEGGDREGAAALMRRHLESSPLPSS